MFGAARYHGNGHNGIHIIMPMNNNNSHQENVNISDVISGKIILQALMKMFIDL